ncbi:MAG: DUF898 domain-containing protein [Natronohydrobacter sp.]|nr:DUF898 domain-containing protein [Natronohydrobacter sp.]
MEKTRFPVKFHGTASEYFGIWIVNLLLSIVTIGIYSAWAKVRTNKYFYQNTEIGGRRFDYHATGGQILIGRIIVVLGFIAVQILAMVPIVLAVVLVAFVFVFPWLLMRSLRFNARVTSWSNVRFNFHGQTGGAFLVYLLYPFLAIFTLFLAWPLADRARRKYAINHHSLGQSRFSLEAGIAPFYGAFFAALGIVLIVLALSLASALPVLSALFTDISLLENDAFLLGNMMLIVQAYIGVIAAFVIAGIVYTAIIRNILFGGTWIEGGHRLHSSVSVPRYVWIALTNALAIIFTLGLMLPWAKVRMARYLADQTQVIVNGDLDDFIGDIIPEGGAFGDAYTDLEAIDVGLPV